MFRIKCDATKQDIVSRQSGAHIIQNIHLHQMCVVFCCCCSHCAGRFVCVTTSHAIFHTLYHISAAYRFFPVVFSSLSSFSLSLLYFIGKLLPFNVSHVSHKYTQPHTQTHTQYTFVAFFRKQSW